MKMCAALRYLFVRHQKKTERLTPEKKKHEENLLLGIWSACGRYEGLDMRTPGGKLAYFPIGQGFMDMKEDGSLMYATINAAGIHPRSGCFRLMENGLMRIEIGEYCGEFEYFLRKRRLELTPCHAFFREEGKYLHQPIFCK